MAKHAPPIADAARPTRRELQRWQEGYRRASEQQRRELTHHGPGGRHAATERAADLLEVAFKPGRRLFLGDAVRRREEAAVRAIWRRLRAGHVK